MATFPFDFRLRRFGIALALYPSDSALAMQIQRAPDSAGSPDTGNAEIIDVVAPGTRTYVDLIGGTKHYRTRHISASGTTGDWTHWVSAVATNIPSVLPNIPKLRDPSIAIEETVGSSSFTVAVTITDPDRRLASEPAFQTRTGVGAYGGTWLTSWDTSTGTIGTDGTIERSEPASFGTTGRASLKLRVQWYDDAGEQQERIEHVELNNENVLKSANLRWVPRQVTTWTAYDCYADLQLLADVKSVHWSAVGSISGADSGNEDISTDGSVLLFASAVGGILAWLRGETITVTFTPYDAIGGDGGAGDAGPSVTRVIEPWDETGSTGARALHEDAPSSVFDGDLMVFAGSGASLDQDTDGRPRLTVAGVATSDLTDLSDVTVTGTPADNEVLAYNSATPGWINQTAAEAGLATSDHGHAAGASTGLDTIGERSAGAGVTVDGVLLKDGGVTATGDVVSNSSDGRLKEDVQPIADALEKLRRLRGVTYQWNALARELCECHGEGRRAGLFAQDVLAVLPEAVRLAPFDRGKDGASKSGERYLTYLPDMVVPLLVEAVKALYARVEELEAARG